MLTTKEAAERLGVSARRVVALSSSGDLRAEKRGGVWFIDDESVASRASAPKLRGRPKAGVKDMRTLVSLTLKCCNHDVLDFTLRTDQRTVVSIDAVHDVHFAPAGICNSANVPTPLLLSAWMQARQVPDARDGLQKMLHDADVRDASDLLVGSLGLSLSDQYWFVASGETYDWYEVNHFDNDYGTVPLRSPNNSTPGVLRKWWEKRDGIDYLIKAGGPVRREPVNELLATRLYERLLNTADYVSYSVEQNDDGIVSVCPCFVDDETELNTMDDIMRGRSISGNRYYAYRDVLEQLGITEVQTALSKMIVVDFLTGNSDRHVHNLGVLRNSQTREWLRVAPLFDNGMSFYAGAANSKSLEDGLFLYTAHPFVDYPSAQLALAEDLSWCDLASLEHFGEVIVENLLAWSDVDEAYAYAVAKQFARRTERVAELVAERTFVQAARVDVLGAVGA